MKSILALMLVMVVGAGCAPAITAGKVIDKQFVAEHLENYTDQEYGCGFGWGYDWDGNYEYGWGCGRMVTVTKQRIVPDAWYLTFENTDSNTEDLYWRTVLVTERVYTNTDIGEWYEVPEEGGS